MKKALIFIKNKLVFLGAVTLAAIVGGATTAVVLASIPDSNGVIHSCYRNSTGALSVIDDATQSCSGNETALSWNQSGGSSGGPLAYAHITYDENNPNEYSVDADRSNNISYVSRHPEAISILCLKVNSGTPKNITGIGGGSSLSHPAVASIKDENGWSSNEVATGVISPVEFCEQNAPTANIAIDIGAIDPGLGKTDFFITVF